METLEIDDSLLSSDSDQVSRRSFVELSKFENKKFVKTKFHEKFMRFLQKLRLFNKKRISVTGIKGIGKTFSLVYFMLDCLKKKDESVHYIDLQKCDFKIESFFEYAKIIKEKDLIIVDHVTLFNKHLVAEITKIRQRVDIAILAVEIGFTASNAEEGAYLFGKDNVLDEEDFNQMWIAQSLEIPDLRERGREVYRKSSLCGLTTPRLLHHFFCHMYVAELSVNESVRVYIEEQRQKIHYFLTQEAGEEYQIFLLHSKLLIHLLFLNDEKEIILTQEQYRHVRIAINIFNIECSDVTKEHLEKDGRFVELGLEENDSYYRLSFLVPCYATFWRDRLSFDFEFLLEFDSSNLINLMFQCGGGRKEIEKLLVEVQKTNQIVLAPLATVPNTTYEESENDCLVPQVELILRKFYGQVFTLKSSHLENLETSKFFGPAKNVAKCAMWIKQKIESNPEDTFILHPDIPNLMGVDYFCKTSNFKEWKVKRPKYENCLFLVQVAAGSSHNGKTVGKALKIVKEVLEDMDLTIHVLIAIVSEEQNTDYCLKKCNFKHASAINLASKLFLDYIKPSFATFYAFIMKTKDLKEVKE